MRGLFKTSRRNPIGEGVWVSVAEPRVMKGRQHEPHRYPYRFLDVVALWAPTPRVNLEYDDQIGGGFQVLLGPVCAEWGKGIEPLLGGPAFVEGAFLGLCALPDLTLDVRVLDDDESPRLDVGSRWG